MHGAHHGLALPLLLAASGVAAGVSVTVADDSGLARWRWEDDAVRLTLVQRLPDQTRAFFGGRGFDRAARERIAGHCVFQMTLENRPETGAPLALELPRWQAVVAGREPAVPRTVPHWDALWEQRQVPQAARIAFRWALFPERQAFEPGDWNMGMLLLDLPAGSVFDLHAAWQRDGAVERVVLPGVECAGDRHL